jgi:hypothetical protein
MFTGSVFAHAPTSSSMGLRYKRRKIFEKVPFKFEDGITIDVVEILKE